MTRVEKWEDGEHWVEVDLDLCFGVSECVDICPVSVYTVVDGKVKAENIGECIECRACQGICPNNAILRHWAWE
jgi:NAD-dependent dihydropyrimidine dehydrogenase PreA subunit